MNIFKIRNLALVLAMCATSAVSAAPVGYTFSTSTGPTGASDIVALLGSDASVTGSFYYNNAGGFLGGSGALGYEPGYALYFGETSQTSVYGNLVGEVAGLAFSDVIGAVAVANDLPGPTGGDALSMVADPTVAAGQQTPPADRQRQLLGFEVGDYTLHNVRLFWTGPASFLPSYALPSQLPGVNGVLALDFIRTDDPTNTAGVPYYSRTVFFQGLSVQAAPVPEPASLALGVVGLAALALTRRRRAQ